MSFGYIAVGIGLVASAAVSAYGANKQGQEANAALSIAGNQEYKQNQAFDQLQTLINNPASFFGSPVYQAAFGQGTQAVSRSSAASFGGGPSGNTATALQAYGQSFGEQQLFSQEELLAGMSGTGFNPSGAVGTASSATSAQTGSLNSL